LLSKNCIFDILNNYRVVAARLGLVVNCFQKIVSLIFWTTRHWWMAKHGKLWIAFKKLYLWYSEQLLRRPASIWISCELLSKNCIFDILNNDWLQAVYAHEVVNCFQKIVSLIFWTTMAENIIAKLRCELLSKNCIFDILNNLPLWFIHIL